MKVVHDQSWALLDAVDVQSGTTNRCSCFVAFSNFWREMKKVQQTKRTPEKAETGKKKKRKITAVCCSVSSRSTNSSGGPSSSPHHKEEPSRFSPGENHSTTQHKLTLYISSSLPLWSKNKFKMHMTFLLIPVLFCVATLLLLQVQALDKSYRISSIHSNLIIDSDRCTTTVTELMTFEFTGKFSKVGRYFPSVDGTLPKISNYKVCSSTLRIPKTYLLDDESGSGRYLIWEFVMPNPLSEQVSIVNFELAFSIDGIFRKGGLSSKYMTLFYSYKWNAPVDKISANVSIAVASNRTTTPDEVVWTPKSDGLFKSRSGEVHLSFLQSSLLLANEPYDITVSLPEKMGKAWGKCKNKLTTREKVGAILGSVFGGIGLIFVCVCAAMLFTGFLFRDDDNTGSTSNTGWSNRDGSWTNNITVHVSGTDSGSVSGGGVSGSSGFAD